MLRPSIEGPISPQYYRAAQINRDIWFTCPVLDFTFQYFKHSPASEIRLYEHNATRFLPAFKQMGVPMWRVAHLSDVPYVLNTQKTVDNSPPQLELSRLISRNILDFVTLGVQNWPSAYEKEDLAASETPSKLTLKLFGGPHGSGAVTSAKGQKGELTEVQRALEKEKLFERCEFINSAKVREETGV